MRLTLPLSCKIAALWAIAFFSPSSLANDIVNNNLFDPSRKPWIPAKEVPPPPPPLPDLTPKDLQIDAILVFGQFRGIIAQLDGQLKGALPANAVGKVRIQIGQNFGAGYTLASVEPNHVVVQTGDKRFVVPLLRKINRGGPPAPTPSPAPPADQQTSAPPPASIPAPSPGSPPASPFGITPGAAASATTASAPPASQTAPPPPTPPETPHANEASQVQASSPMSLLDAIRQAQEAAKSRSGSNQAPTSPGTPFFGIGT
jgi:hypothetical protein